MGIPGFFKRIIDQYNNIIISKLDTKPNRLFIDFNCIIHQCASIVSHDNPNNSITLEILENLIIQKCVSYLYELIDMVKPSDLVYVAIDGVCPRAKMSQQRKRRFISSLKTSSVVSEPEYIAQNNIYWNSNSVTPGTLFMNNLDKHLNHVFKNENKIVISPSSSFGEGEHKIFNYLHHNTTENSVDIVYGLDADLILLGILHANNKNDDNNQIYLLRENQHFNTNFKNPFLYLDLNNLKKQIISFYNPSNNHFNFIQDYVFLCTLLGNDFLPPLSFIKTKDDSIDLIISFYNLSIQNQTIENYLIDSVTKTINWNIFRHVIKQISNIEDVSFNIACEKYHSKIISDSNSLSQYQKMVYYFDNYPIFQKNDYTSINPKVPGWRIEYYRNLFNYSSLNDICENYCKGLYWIVHYYFHGDPHLNWYYKYSYSPTALDLSNYINFQIPSNEHHNDTSNDEFKNIMKNSNIQLLLVLPPDSQYLIPDKNSSNLMTDVSLNCVHYYPIKFKISSFLKSFIWECSAVLPDINLQNLLYNLNKKITN